MTTTTKMYNKLLLKNRASIEFAIENVNRCTGKSTSQAMYVISKAMTAICEPVSYHFSNNFSARDFQILVLSILKKLDLDFFEVSIHAGVVSVTYNPYGTVEVITHKITYNIIS